MTEASATLGKMLQRMKQKLKEARAHYTNWHINADEFLWDVDVREGDGKKLVKAIYNNRFAGSNSGKAIHRTMEDIMKDAEKALKSK